MIDDSKIRSVIERNAQRLPDHRREQIIKDLTAYVNECVESAKAEVGKQRQPASKRQEDNNAG